jgi:hypothetical protein
MSNSPSEHPAAPTHDPAYLGASRRPARAYLPLLASALKRGHAVPFQVRGHCMWPALKSGDKLAVKPLSKRPQTGDILVCYRGTHAVAHRVVDQFQDAEGQGWVRCRGDASLELDAAVRESDVVGVVTKIRRASTSLQPSAAAALSSRVVAPARAALGWMRAKLEASARSLPPSAMPLRALRAKRGPGFVGEPKPEPERSEG